MNSKLIFSGQCAVIATRNDGEVQALQPASNTELDRGRAFIDALDHIGNTGGQIQLGAGVYAFTSPISLPANITLRGQGMFNTALKLLPPDDFSKWGWSAASGGIWFISNPYSGSQSLGGCTIQDLTLDCNWPAIRTALAAAFGSKSSTNRDISGLFLSGSNNAIQAVRCVNYYGNLASRHECFPLCVGSGQNVGMKNAVIEGCILDRPQGDYFDGFCVFGSTDYFRNKYYLDGAVVRNNVNLSPGSLSFINTAYVTNLEVYGNLSYGSVGYHHDTGGLSNLSFHDNKIIGCPGDGICLMTGLTNDPMSNLRFFDNDFELIHHAFGDQIVFAVQSATSATVTDVEFSRNRCRFNRTGRHEPKPDGGDIVAAFGLQSHLDGVRIFDNTIDSFFATAGSWSPARSGATHVQLRGNRDFMGKPLSGLADNFGIRAAAFTLATLPEVTQGAIITVTDHATGSGVCVGRGHQWIDIHTGSAVV